MVCNERKKSQWQKKSMIADFSFLKKQGMNFQFIRWTASGQWNNADKGSWQNGSITSRKWLALRAGHGDRAQMARAFLLYMTEATPFANGGSIYVPKSNFVLNPLFELAYTIASRIPVHHYWVPTHRNKNHSNHQCNQQI